MKIPRTKHKKDFRKNTSTVQNVKDVSLQRPSLAGLNPGHRARPVTPQLLPSDQLPLENLLRPKKTFFRQKNPISTQKSRKRHFSAGKTFSWKKYFFCGKKFFSRKKISGKFSGIFFGRGFSPGAQKKSVFSDRSKTVGKNKTQKNAKICQEIFF